MEPISYGNRERQAPLRSSPPRDRITNSKSNLYKDSSPLRRSPQRSPNQQNPTNDDERYEQRRQEELRRQIRAKEKELEQISSSKERFKQRIERTLGLNGSYPDIPRPHDSTISKKNPSPFRYNQEQQETRERFPQYSRPGDSNRRDSPLRTTSKAKSFEREPPKFVSSFQETEPRSKPYVNRGGSDYASQLYNDNQQLQRRLNLVVAELDRVNREKNAQKQRLSQVNDIAESFMHQIHTEERDDNQMQDLNHELSHTRDDNLKIQDDIKSTDQQRSEYLNRLRMLQAERERRVGNCEDISSGLVKKMTVMKDLEKQIQDNQMQINEIDRQLPALERQNHEDNHRVHDIHLIIDRLTNERDELMDKLQHLNMTYDQTVAEISRERAQLESHNKRHTQLLTSKIIFQAIEAMVVSRKQASLNEFFNYCKFDEKCHKTLKTFVGILHRCGKFQMRMGLKRWFQNALQPMKVYQQEEDFAKKYVARKIAIKSQNSTETKLNSQMSTQQRKLEACKNMIMLRKEDLWKEKARYMTIWRDVTRLSRQRQDRLRILIKRQISNRQRIAMQQWLGLSREIESLVRCHILKKAFAIDQYKLIAFNQLKFATIRHKRIRLMKLKHLFKAWQDSNAYRKYIMGQIVSASTLRKVLDSRLLQHCFSSLRHNKETEKQMLVEDKLKNDTAPEIANLNFSIGDLSAKTLRTERLRKLEALKGQSLRGVASYFNHWKQTTSSGRVFVSKNFKDMLNRRYQGVLHQAFNHWSNGKDDKKRKLQSAIVDDIQEKNKGLLSGISSLGKDNFEEALRQQTRSRVKLTRGCNIFAKRTLKYGMRRWRAVCQILSDKEKACKYLTNLVKLAKLRAAWKLYRKQVLQKRQDVKDSERAEFFRKTLNARTMRRHFNALCVFVHNFKKSKVYWSIVLQKMDVWMKKRAFLSWIENAHRTRVVQLQQIQNTESVNFDDLNRDLRKKQESLQDCSGSNKEQNEDLMKRARKLLGLYFYRTYTSSIERTFGIWKQGVINIKHREKIMRKVIDNWKFYRFQFAKAAWQNWIHRCRKQEHNESIRSSKIEIDEQSHRNEYNRQQHEEQKTALEQEIAINDAEAQLHHSRAQYLLAAMIRKNDLHYYQSNKRYIFQQWCLYIKRIKRFGAAINNIVRKSCIQNGFDNINAFSRDKNLTRGQSHAINYFKRLLFKFQVGGRFNKWRSYEIAAVNNEIKDTDALCQLRIQRHDTFVQGTKDFNMLRSSQIIRKFQLHNLMRGWKNVTLWRRSQKKANEKKEDHWLAYQVRLSIKKWAERKRLTIKVRGHHARFLAFRGRLYMKACFAAMKVSKTNAKDLCSRLSEAALKFNNLNLQTAFYRIRNFRNSKDLYQQRQQRQAATDLGRILHELYQRKMISNLSNLRTKVIQQKKRSLTLLGMINQRWIQRLRKLFFKWKMGAGLLATQVEVNEEGPVVDKVLESQMVFANLKGFMAEQGYRQFEIDDIVAITSDKQSELLARSVARWRAYRGPNDAYLRPKMFDRWRAYVKLRKLVRYHLRNMENRLQPVKADLSIAFNRWKYNTGNSHKRLNGKDKKELVAKCADNHRNLDRLEDRTADTEEYLGHMGMQRDELVDNYMKSQRLAVALGRDNLQRGQAKGLGALSDNMNAQKRNHFEEVLQRNINLIASLKDKIQEFEVDNESIANENEELRQFSLDGYQIAKNVQSLSNEREKLSVDLADKANTIRKLLDENEHLSCRLRDAQQNAARLIQQSNHNLRSMQRQPSAAYF